jgi:hypothetical protein
MTPALVLALSLMVQAAPPPDDGGEPLPPGAPAGGYELSAWCYGALSEYLQIYDKVKPQLVAIDKLFGEPVAEAEPYQADMAAARKELKMIGDAVTAAEKASARPISEEGADAVRRGRGIWSVAERKTNRELARAWLTWGLPDKCDSNSRQLASRSALLGSALKFNTGEQAQPAEAPAPVPAPIEPAAPAFAEPATKPTPPAHEAAPPTEDTPAAQAAEIMSTAPLETQPSAPPMEPAAPAPAVPPSPPLPEAQPPPPAAAPPTPAPEPAPEPSADEPQEPRL